MAQFIDRDGHSGIIGGGTAFELEAERDMARRNWFRCICGAKLHVKAGIGLCYKCTQKASKEK